MNKKFLMLCCALTFTLGVRAFCVQPPEIESQTAIVADAKTGQVVYEKDADKKMYPASTTKIMTAIIALESGELDDRITVSNTAVEGLYEMGSAVNLKPGETLTLEQLVKYLLVASGNDAANVIAEHFGGSNEAFAEIMNQKAKEIGCTSTNFVNPHGLHDENHYTTARDLYLIGAYAMKNPVFEEIVKLKEYTIEPNEVCKSKRLFYTTNHLISRWKKTDYIYSRAIGIKTGYTTPAGHCLVSGAAKGEQVYYSVVLGAPINQQTAKIMSFVDTKNLLEWAFDNFSQKEILSENKPVAEVAVKAAKDKDFLALEPQQSVVKLLANDFDVSQITVKTQTDDNIKAPIKKGDVLGEATLEYDGKQIASVPLVAANDIERSLVLYVLLGIGEIFSSTLFKIIFAAVVCIIVIFVVYMIMVNKKRRKYSYRNYTNRRR